MRAVYVLGSWVVLGMTAYVLPFGLWCEDRELLVLLCRPR